jgi:hypothetical protein
MPDISAPDPDTTIDDRRYITAVYGSAFLESANSRAGGETDRAGGDTSVVSHSCCVVPESKMKPFRNVHLET